MYFAEVKESKGYLVNKKNDLWMPQRIPSKLAVKYKYNKFLRLASLLKNRAITWISIKLGS